MYCTVTATDKADTLSIAITLIQEGSNFLLFSSSSFVREQLHILSWWSSHDEDYMAMKEKLASHLKLWAFILGIFIIYHTSIDHRPFNALQTFLNWRSLSVLQDLEIVVLKACG